MKTLTAKICNNCDEIYEGYICPVCLSESSVNAYTVLGSVGMFHLTTKDEIVESETIKLLPNKILIQYKGVES
jgi:hypothetical protein